MHASLVEQLTVRLVKWERLVQTVATLPAEVQLASTGAVPSPQLETSLPLGTQLVSAWRPDPSPDGLELAPKLVVIVVDVQCSVLRLLEVCPRVAMCLAARTARNALALRVASNTQAILSDRVLYTVLPQ